MKVKCNKADVCVAECCEAKTEHESGDDCFCNSGVEGAMCIPVPSIAAAEIDAAHRATDNSTLRFGPNDSRDTDIANLKQAAKYLLGLVNSLESRLANMEFRNAYIGQQFRDECAMRAMQGFCGNTTAEYIRKNIAVMSQLAYDLADAMVAERDRRNGGAK